MRRSGSAIWFAACSLGLLLAACKSAPVVDWRVVDERGFVNGAAVILAFEAPASQGMACISADDTYRMIKGCKQGNGVPDVIFCIWDLQSQAFGCSDESIRGVEQLINWSCLSPRDLNRFLNYCRRMKPQAGT